MPEENRPLALTMGDPAGIGPEITAGAWQALRGGTIRFAVVGDAALIARHGVPVRDIGTIAQVADVFAQAVPVLPVALAAPVTPGQPDSRNAGAITTSIARAVELARNGQAGAVVTNPISKIVLKKAGFAYPGHTEYLAALCNVPGREVMMLACPELRVVPITIHVSLRRALDELSTEGIIAATRTTHAALIRDFGIAAPRIAMAGLNPHAGEDGSMGTEEQTLIIPAIETLRRDGMDITGPWPPDTLFTPPARARYDVAMCMYHDQALIPLKTIDMTNGVNTTLGLPIIRTSPDHGTAFDIAGRGVADPASLVAALRMAGRMAEHRNPT
ncbi:4-hydroxythreonine-4-phosphate dehydrogenase [Gluconacetobacter sp. SXCC-1]|uniref:4-hydroxythreonine-4-phosphate dehydrogenase n=1 Tax=Komagataeibacter rhaeticus TaxID=215221 RepID=A0A181C6I1_9PROT|nr:4-hydroxythreonine-4-phosphate dehydrogenase PdxA [Komagataeibacter rhaeticus]ATU73930.1 4-hydroxythreonine-4-phosphate dehydrogenase PdxA [Komagataeibacter xylinus]EGG78224.1 4-hydroxythreonine-4-phosphate dehydrogenase [Gluconacetobacter sp. SXCC-1]QIP34174.1 4-hydroxythreonine-4-phosphate dehydrogenase PdxA [Komagataeibacter rhaeticus]QOC46684.1 4-hydroxythreonine-4-phosphate dehydrogenase PdxA [Komagataeibacter rhaeticus]WPP20945.1 4-hydroxythreonine-4-phosphate dehydrogenase PdxA [Koma